MDDHVILIENLIYIWHEMKNLFMIYVSIACIIAWNELRNFHLLLQQKLSSLEGSLNPSSFIGEGLSDEMNLLCGPRLTHSSHYCGNVKAWIKIMISCSIRVCSPELIDALLYPLLFDLYLMHQTEFLQDFPNENLLSGVNIHALGIVWFANYCLILFIQEIVSFIPNIYWLPNLGEIIMKSSPKLSCYHIVVGSQKKIVLAWSKIEGLTSREISNWNSSHFFDTAN